MNTLATIKQYYRLTKPGIIYGNSLSAIAGFLFASQGHIDWLLFATTVLGVALVIAASCVFNNYMDRDIDSKMARTQKRALVSGIISPRSAIIYAIILAAVGFGLLGVFVNVLTLVLGIIAMFFYVVVYGYAKRASWHGTLVGTIPGSLPLVAGYTAVIGSLDITAGILFLIMAIWQMPHFYAISLYRKQDYAAAGIPVISVVKGERFAALATIGYIALFALVVPLLTIYSFAGYTYLVVMSLFAIRWLLLAIYGYDLATINKWARQVFGNSLSILLMLSLLLSINNLVI